MAFLAALIPAMAAAAGGAGAAGAGAAAAGAAAAGAATATTSALAGAAATTAAGTAAASGISLSSALGLASAAVGVLGQVSAEQAQSKADQFNAQIAAQQATEERQSAALRADEIRRKGARQLSTQNALLAAQGADTTTGQSLLFQSETARETQYQASLAEYDGERSAQAYDLRSDTLRRRSRGATLRGFSRGAPSLLSAAGGIAKQM